MKTIGVMISDQHLIAHGGIGQFCRSLTKLLHDQHHQVVLITDKKPRKGFNESVKADWTIYPNQPLSYAEHRGIYGRFSEGPNLTKIVNFESALENANNFFNFDIIVANSSESIAALANVRFLDSKVKRVMYTHSYKQIHPEAQFNGIFTDEYHNFFQQFLYKQHVIVATQSKYNQSRLYQNGCKDVKVLPMPLTEISLLQSSSHIDKSGILYIGRWEDGKNPKDYLKVIKQTKLPAKVMTNKIGAEKFVKAFNKMGHTNYVIKAGIIGQEKVDFIKGCKVFFCTGLHECYPNTYVECLGHMPVVTLTKMVCPWTNSFPPSLVNKVDIKIAGDTIQSLYNSNINNDEGLIFVNNLHQSAYDNWANYIGE